MRSLVLFALAAATAATPHSWKKATPYAELSLELPAQIGHVPVLADRLYRGEVKTLTKFAAEAGDPKDGLRSESAQFRSQGRWEMQVTFRADVETPRLISLVRTSFEDRHGAHPNHTLEGVVFDKATNTNLHPLDLLKSGADLKSLDKALCDAARKAKREKLDTWVEKDDPNFNCPTWNGLAGVNGKRLERGQPAQITLVKSDVPGRAAGLQFLYSPYDLGAYVEGEYELAIPTVVFQSALKPEYAKEFSGSPRPVNHDD